MNKLIAKLGDKKTTEYLDRLNNYIGSKGVKYKSHYHTILNWHNKDNTKGGVYSEKSKFEKSVDAGKNFIAKNSGE